MFSQIPRAFFLLYMHPCIGCRKLVLPYGYPSKWLAYHRYKLPTVSKNVKKYFTKIL